MALEGSSHAHDRSEEGVTIWNISSHSEILNVKLILFSDLIFMCKMTPPRQLLESSTFASTFKFNAKQSKGGWQQFKHWNDSCKQTQWLVQTFNWLIKTFNWLMQTLQRLMHKSNENNKKTWRYQHMLPQPPALEPYKVTLSLHQEENLLHQPISF